MKKYVQGSGYVQLKKPVNGERLEHRAVWATRHGKIPKGMQVHHRNGDKLDNRLENLELVSMADNMQKSDRWGKGYRMSHHTKLKYRAQRQINGKKVEFGLFATPCGAYMASRMGYVNGGC